MENCNQNCCEPLAEVTVINHNISSQDVFNAIAANEDLGWVRMFQFIVNQGFMDDELNGAISSYMHCCSVPINWGRVYSANDLHKLYKNASAGVFCEEYDECVMEYIKGVVESNAILVPNYLDIIQKKLNYKIKYGYNRQRDAFGFHLLGRFVKFPCSKPSYAPITDVIERRIKSLIWGLLAFNREFLAL